MSLLISEVTAAKGMSWAFCSSIEVPPADNRHSTDESLALLRFLTDKTPVSNTLSDRFSRKLGGQFVRKFVLKSKLEFRLKVGWEVDVTCSWDKQGDILPVTPFVTGTLSAGPVTVLASLISVSATPTGI